MDVTTLQELDLNKTYTYTDYVSWKFQERVELIKGKIFEMSPAPRRIHQEISGEMSRQIYNHLLKKSCKAYDAPFDVRLPKKGQEAIYTVVQPDICVVCDLEKLDEAGCIGPPDLIIEILSKHTSKKDVSTKFELYEESGVKEYWIVSPGDQIVDVFHLADKKYQLIKKYNNEDTVPSQVIDGLEINLKLVFSE